MTDSSPTSESDGVDARLLEILDLAPAARRSALEAHCAARPDLAFELRQRYGILVKFELLSDPDPGESSAPTRVDRP